MAVLILAAATLPGGGYAQIAAFNQMSPLSQGRNGVHLYGVTAYSGYYSGSSPFGFDLPGARGSTPLVGGTVYGGAATFGWTESTEKTSLSASYSPSYFGSAEQSGLNTFNHQLLFNWSRKIGPKWGWNVAASAILANLQQLLFNPTAYSSLASLPATFDNLSGAMLASRFTDAQLASILTGASVLGSPEQAYAYGGRLFSTSVQTGVSWARSERSSISVNVAATRSQHLNGSETQGSGSVATPGYLVPQTTAGTISAAWSYALSPRTQFSASATMNRTVSQIQDGRTTSGSVSLGRTMSRRWFVQGRIGVGSLNYSRIAVPPPRGIQYLAGGSIGYKTAAHTFLASYDRSVGDAYGLGSGATKSATVAWNWRPPGSGWTVFSSFGRQTLAETVFPNTTSWRATAGVARALGHHVVVNTQYGYMQLPYAALAQGRGFDENGVIVTLSWSPAAYR